MAIKSLRNVFDDEYTPDFLLTIDPANGQILLYDAANGVFVNATLTKAQVGLGSVDNTSDADKPVSTAQQTALDLKAPVNSPAFTGTVTGVTSTMVGLGNVDDTSDADKPVSTAQQTALDLKASVISLTAQTSSFTAVAGGQYGVDCSTPVVTVTLPATPADNDFVEVIITVGATTNNLIFARNSSTIMGLAEDYTVDVEITSISFIYFNSTWRVI